MNMRSSRYYLFVDNLSLVLYCRDHGNDHHWIFSVSVDEEMETDLILTAMEGHNMAEHKEWSDVHRPVR